MKRIAVILCLLCSPAFGQDIRSVPLNVQERAIVLEMCAAAQWAARQRFDGYCDWLRLKFDKAPAEKVEKPSTGDGK